MIEKLKEIGKELGVYKILLTCSENNVGFYEKCGLERKSVCMALYNENK